MIKTDLAKLLPKSKFVDSYLECAAGILPRIKCLIFGNEDAIRNYRITISSAKFSGHIHILLGPGSGEINILGSGPMGLDLRMSRNAKLFIGEATTINGARIICDDADVSIGADNMWSDEIIVQANDQHGIIKRSTLEITNNHRPKIQVGDHVWIGRRAMLLPDVSVGKGSIIAAGAVLTSSVPEYCAYGGVPAKKIADDISWSRSPSAISKDEMTYLR